MKGLRNVWFLAIIFSFFVSESAATERPVASGPSKRDTVSALVLYGNDMLFQSTTELDVEELIEFKNNFEACTAEDTAYLQQLDLFIRLNFMTKRQVNKLIDSLFEADQVPYALVNQINFYLMTHTPAEKWWVHMDTSFYPAHRYYQSWNTHQPNPYPASLIEHDSTMSLLLQNDGKLGEFHMPVENVLTSKFGMRDGKMHKGIDIDLEVWDTVRAAFSGVVRFADTYQGYGRLVVIRHYNGLETYYAHLHRIKVKAGQTVEGGKLIGLGGSSGRSTGSHLHFECRFKGIPIDPLAIIDIENKQLFNDTIIVHKTSTGFACFPKGATFYTVKKGDCLSGIADTYGTNIESLCKLNGIRRNSYLWVGQKLRII